MPDFGPNSHIADYLRHYIGQPQPPGFAVMVTGAWGSGKTRFINDFLPTLDLKKRTLIQLSLYGMGTTADIDSAIFLQLHPVFANKKLRMAARFGAAFLKGTFKVGFDDDGATGDATFSLSIPEVSEEGSTDRYERLTFIFDDLERCDIAPSLLLGYLNQLIEIYGCKVVLISNEAKLSQKAPGNDTTPSYAEIKDKLVGITFAITPAPTAAITGFINDIQDTRTRNALNEHRATIDAVVRRCQLDNFRFIKHALYDFPRLYQAMPADVIAQPEALTHLLEVFLTLHIEHHRGNLHADSFDSIGHKTMLIVRQHSKTTLGEADKELKQFHARHPDIQTGATLLSNQTWRDIIVHGRSDPLVLQEDSDTCSLLHPEKVPTWVTLWDPTGLTDEAIQEHVDTLQAEIGQRLFRYRPTILHVFGALLHLARAGVHPDSETKVKKQAKAYIDTVLKEHGGLQAMLDNDSAEAETVQRYAGQASYPEHDTPAFKEIEAYLNEAIDKAKAAAQDQEASTLLAQLPTAPEDTLQALTWRGGFLGPLAADPVLQGVSGTDFLQAITTLPSHEQTAFLRDFMERYRDASTRQSLYTEDRFLRELAAALERHAQDKKGLYSAFKLGEMAGLVRNSGQALELIRIDNSPPPPQE